MLKSAFQDFADHFRSDKKVWLAMGNSFIQLPRDKAQSMLKRDQLNLDTEINLSRTKLKDGVSSLREKEGDQKLKGFDLASMSKDDKRFIGS